VTPLGGTAHADNVRSIKRLTIDPAFVQRRVVVPATAKSSIRACPGAGRSAFLADPHSADAEPVMLGQFGCPLAGADLVTRVGVGDPEAKPAHSIARAEGDVVVSEHLARGDDGRNAVWVVEA
jgi:hypothetical protein